jgi:hypothetical protein
MRKIIATAAFGVAVLAGAASAEACWWNGYNWNCYNEAYNFPLYTEELGTYPPYWYYFNPGGVMTMGCAGPVVCAVR